MNVEAGQIWTDEEDTYLIVGANEGTFNALKISQNDSIIEPLELLYVEVGVDADAIKEELTFTRGKRVLPRTYQGGRTICELYSM